MGVLGVILGILAVICAIFATMLFGTVGGIAAAVVAVVAILLGILKRAKDKKGGIAAIVIGLLAVVMAFGVTNVWSNMFKRLHEKAVEYKPDGIWAQVSEEADGGLMGILSKVPRDEAGLNALIDEMNELNKMSENQ